MRASTAVLVAAAAVPVLGQSGAWGQCGGIGWSGPTTCISGYTCVKQPGNDYYSQCLPGTAVPSSSTAKVSSSFVTSVKASATPSSTPSTPWWFGVNLSGAEFGEKSLPGVYGRDYIWYNHSAIDMLVSKGMNMFRVNFLMERVTPNSLTGPLDSLYVGNLTADVNYITSKGAYAVVQPHNYGRFYGNIITDTAAFQTWWKNVAVLYKNNPLVVFDTNNEYHDMDQQLVYNLNQAAINGVRAAGATTQYITPEGNNWTGAWTWVSSGNGASLVSLTDPTDASGSKLIYQMHQYLDIDGSGTHDDCVSSTILQERLVAATNWLRANKKKGLIGEYGSGSNPTCITALQGGLQYLKANRDVWMGNLWWAAGPWWGSYSYSMEPSTGNAFVNVLPSILPYAK